jgi:tyrosine-protein phosphatase YwqE
VLARIDDGPADMEEALALVRAAAEVGTATLAATPHLPPDFSPSAAGAYATRSSGSRSTSTRRRRQSDLARGR